MAAKRDISTEALAERLARAPGFAEARAAAERAGIEARLIGGAVRDALLGRRIDNLDLVVEGEPAQLIAELGGDALVHERFGTATVELAGGAVDVAAARTETYPHPGALPEVEPASFADDIGRRDFTVNAIAVALDAPGELLDPLDGLGDLGAGLLRVLHPGTFADDPTRALRAARYAARLGFELEPRTLELIRATDLGTISAERRAAELGRLAAEPAARRGFELLARWGLLDLAPGGGQLIDRLDDLLARPPWAGEAPRPAAVLAAVRGPTPEVAELAGLEPGSPSRAVAAARGRSGVELALARALGAAWLDDYVGEWRAVALEISGEDLIEAGIERGPAVGRGLGAALRAKLDGETDGRDDELRIALSAARS